MRKSPSLDLTSLPVKDLIAIQAQLPKLITQKQTDATQALRQKLERMANEVNFSVGSFELIPIATAQEPIKPALPAAAANGNTKRRGKSAKPVKSKGGVLVKYRDSKNPENTWSGRGRPARWLAAYEKQGMKREQFAVA